MRVTLNEWNKNYFREKPRCSKQLYRYIHDGKIYPVPVKVGRGYVVESYAILINDELIQNPSLMREKLNEQAERSQNQRFTA